MASLFRPFSLLSTAVISVAGLTATAADNPVLSLNPASQSVSAGLPFAVSLDITGLTAGGPDSVGAFDVDLLFDDTLVQFTSVSFGDSILGDQLDVGGSGPVSQSDDSVPGAVNLFELSLDSAAQLDALQAGDFTLATISFLALDAGSAALTFNINALSDSFGAPLEASVQSAMVNIRLEAAVIPESPTFLLLPTLLGAIGAAWYTSRRRAERLPAGGL